MKSDEKLILASVVALGFGAWYVKRQAAQVIGAAGKAVQNTGSAIGSGVYDVLNPGANAAAGGTYALPVGSPGWYASQGLPIPASAYDQTTWLSSGGLL